MTRSADSPPIRTSVAILRRVLRRYLSSTLVERIVREVSESRPRTGYRSPAVVADLAEAQSSRAPSEVDVARARQVRRKLGI